MSLSPIFMDAFAFSSLPASLTGEVGLEEEGRSRKELDGFTGREMPILAFTLKQKITRFFMWTSGAFIDGTKMKPF